MRIAYLAAMVLSAGDGGVLPEDEVHVIRLGPGSGPAARILLPLSTTLSEAEEMVRLDIANTYANALTVDRVQVDQPCDADGSCIEAGFRVSTPLSYPDLHILVRLMNVNGLWCSGAWVVTELP